MPPETSAPPGPSKPADQDPVERVIERGIVLSAKALVTLLFVAAIYGVLTLSFVLCCGSDVSTYANPTRSPLGPVLTILIVWPIGGFLCLIPLGGPATILRKVRAGVEAAMQAIRPDNDA